MARSSIWVASAIARMQVAFEMAVAGHLGPRLSSSTSRIMSNNWRLYTYIIRRMIFGAGYLKTSSGLR